MIVAIESGECGVAFFIALARKDAKVFDGTRGFIMDAESESEIDEFMGAVKKGVFRLDQMVYRIETESMVYEEGTVEKAPEKPN